MPVAVSAQGGVSNPQEGFLKINIFGMVEGMVANQVLMLSGALFALTGKKPYALEGYPVHNTIYLTDYPDGGGDLVNEICTRIGGKIWQFSSRPLIKTNGLVRPTGGWCFLDIEPTAELRAIQYQVIGAVSDLRDPSCPAPDWLAAFPEKFESFGRFGSPNVGEHYNPHFTLYSDADPELLDTAMANEVVLSMAEPILSGMSHIGVGIADDKGQVTQIVRTFPL